MSNGGTSFLGFSLYYGRTKIKGSKKNGKKGKRKEKRWKKNWKG